MDEPPVPTLFSENEDVPVLSSDDGIISTVKKKAKKLYDTINTPIVDVSPKTKEAMSSFSQEHPYLGKVGELATGAMTGMSSPLSLGLMGTGLAAPALGRAGLTTAAQAMRAPGLAAAGGAVVHGGINAVGALKRGDYPEALGGVLESGIGGLGLHGGLKVSAPETPGIKPTVEPLAKPTLEESPIKPTLESPIKPVIKPTVEAPLVPGEKVSIKPTAPETKPVVKTISRVASEPAAMPTDPVDAVKKWGWGKKFAPESANEVKAQFADLKDKPELVGKFQEGSREGQLADVQRYFDEWHDRLVKVGVLKEDQFKDNYLKQIWANTPEEIAAVYNKKGQAAKPGLAKSSFLETYKDGIDMGLTPKYNNIPDIMGAYEHEAVNALRDQKLKNYFKAIGTPLGKGSISNPAMWQKIAEVSPEAQGMIANYFSKSPDALKNVSDVIGATRNLSLAQGLPGRTGTISAHGFNFLRRSMQAVGFGPAIKDFVKTTYNPASDVEFIDANRPALKGAIENGLAWRGGDYSTGSVDKVLKDIPVIGAARDMQTKFLEDPLFKVKGPALQLKFYLNRYNELAPKIGEKEAARAAASYANDFSGYVDKTFKNKTLWDIAQSAMLSPSWTRSGLNIAGKGLTGKPGYVAPMLRGSAMAAAPVVAGIASKGVGKYLSGKPAEVAGIPAGETDNKERSVEPLGTAVEPQRMMLQMGTQLGQGNLTFPFKYELKNKLSPVAGAVNNLMNNQDSYGNDISGKDRFGKAIPAITALKNFGQEATRPLTPGVVEALIDASRSKGSPEEVLSRALGLPITYTSKKKDKKASPNLKDLK